MRSAAIGMPAWVRARDGLAGVGARLRQRACRIAYLGASVTAQHDGYRHRLHRRLEEVTGQTHRAVHAGIGGVGAITGVFLMDDLVVRHRPDLCFVEFSTGDSADDTNACRVGPAAEGIVRKLHAIDCPMVLLHCHRREIEGTTRLASVVARWEEVADRYGVPSLHLHRLVASQLAEDATRERRWFRDVVHTTTAGTELLADSILDALLTLPDAAVPLRRPPPRFAGHCGSTRLVPVQPAMAEEPGACSTGIFRFVYPWLAVQSANTLRIRSADDVMGLLVVVGSDAGILEVRTDRGGETIVAFDAWCHYDRLHAHVFDTPGPLHEVGVRLTTQPVDHSVCRRPLASEATVPKRLRAIAWMVREMTGGDPATEGVRLR
jgi:hypothetical protein